MDNSVLITSTSETVKLFRSFFLIRCLFPLEYLKPCSISFIQREVKLQTENIY